MRKFQYFFNIAFLFRIIVHALLNVVIVYFLKGFVYFFVIFIYTYILVMLSYVFFTLLKKVHIGLTGETATKIQLTL